ncbi:MAG TPA: TlpA disulfide reductase family protein [Candidatus Acidoferrales bacterium]|nr:TlpA disulfide reductase family protein [Candidatus Acidoferrales bacterium]
MKKTLTVLLTVAALVAVVWYADSVTRRPLAQSKQEPDNPVVAPLAPDVTMKNLQDKDVSLSQYKGNVVLVNFWATWCEPCRDEIPLLIELQRKYGGQGFVVLGVAMDEGGKKAVVPYFEHERFDVNGKKEAMNYPILIGTDDVAHKFDGLIGFPTSFLISRDGRLVKRIMGRVDYDEIEKSIKSLL